LVVFAVLGAGSLVFAVGLRRLVRPAGSRDWDRLDPYDLAVLRGGARALFEAAVARPCTRR
jgi:hypothetical protein